MSFAARQPAQGENNMQLSVPLKRLALGAALVSAVSWCAPAAFADHAGAQPSRSATAGMPDGASMTLEGRLAILDFVHGTSRERLYALVAADGTATRLAFGPNAGELRQGMALAVTARRAQRRHRR
jgi:hypothetical protein